MIPFIAAAAAIGGDYLGFAPSLPGWNRGIRVAQRQAERAKCKPIDAMAECRRFEGRAMLHVLTGEVREPLCLERLGVVEFQLADPTRGGSYILTRSPRKALRWLRNAVEVQS